MTTSGNRKTGKKIWPIKFYIEKYEKIKE